ncbi:amidohydrolase family protein [Caballeronia udeis]|uniref:amidohydrolase family protein n=1 Tax=Caballeronia udeis TaxID=1232866 RepID=UPI0038B232FE
MICRLVAPGNCYVKLSAPYQASPSGPDYPEMNALDHKLISLRSARILWGSNRPHTNPVLSPGRSALDVNPFHDIDYA